LRGRTHPYRDALFFCSFLSLFAYLAGIIH